MAWNEQYLKVHVYGLFLVVFMTYSTSIITFPGGRSSGNAGTTKRITTTSKAPEQNVEEKNNNDFVITACGLLFGGLFGYAFQGSVINSFSLGIIGGLTGGVFELGKKFYEQHTITKKQQWILTKSLFTAIAQNDRSLEEIKELVEAGADAQCKNITGENLLMLYFLRNYNKSFFNKSIMKLLIDKGVSPYGQNDEGDTIFHCGADNGLRWNFLLSLNRKNTEQDKKKIINILSAKRRKEGLFGGVPKPVLKMVFEYFLEVSIEQNKNPFTIVTHHALHGIKNNKGQTAWDVAMEMETNK